MTSLDPSQSRLLGALTIVAAQHLGGETSLLEEDNSVRQVRMARIGDVVLIDHPADASGPRSINCYLITEHSADGAAFKLDPSRLVYSLRWLHKAQPPDFELVLMQQDAELWQRWVNAASLTLLAELRRQAPHAIDWTAMGDIVPLLDAFEAAMHSRRRIDIDDCRGSFPVSR